MIRIIKDLDLSGPIDLLEVYSSPPEHEGGFGKVYTVHSEARKLAVKIISIGFCCTNPGNSNVGFRTPSRQTVKVIVCLTSHLKCVFF